MGGNGSLDFDKFKKQFMDLVYDLHARKLAIPAGILLVAIFAAVFMLPKSPAPPPPANTAPVAEQAQDDTVKTQPVAQLSLIGVSSLDDSNPLANSKDPFNATTGSSCTEVSGTDPKEFYCRVGDLKVRVVCPVDDTPGICAEKATGASGASGGAGGEGSGGATGGGGSTGGGGGGTKKKKAKKTTYYEVSVSLDGRTYKNLIAGDGVPNDKNALAVYAGEASSTRAIFIAGDSVSVSGVDSDPSLGTFELKAGQSATLTDKANAQHVMKMISIKKVTK